MHHPYLSQASKWENTEIETSIGLAVNGAVNAFPFSSGQTDKAIYSWLTGSWQDGQQWKRGCILWCDALHLNKSKETKNNLACSQSDARHPGAIAIHSDGVVIVAGCVLDACAITHMPNI
jgi:hypothetical protein